MAQLHEAGSLAELQPLHEQLDEGLAVHQSELVDRREVRMLPAADHPERHVFMRRPLDTTRREHARAVAVEQEAQHHLRRIRPLPTAILRLNDTLYPRK